MATRMSWMMVMVMGMMAVVQLMETRALRAVAEMVPLRVLVVDRSVADVMDRVRSVADVTDRPAVADRQRGFQLRLTVVGRNGK